MSWFLEHIELNRFQIILGFIGHHVRCYLRICVIYYCINEIYRHNEEKRWKGVNMIGLGKCRRGYVTLKIDR